MFSTADSARKRTLKDSHNRSDLGRSGLRSVLLAGVDVVSWMIAGVFCAAVASNLSGSSRCGESVGVVIVAAILHLVSGLALGLYRGRFRIGSQQEARRLILVTVGAGATAAVSGLVVREEFAPVAGPLVGQVAAAAVMVPFVCVVAVGIRALMRVLHDHRRRPDGSATRVIILGAGEVGSLLARRMLVEGGSCYLPVAFLDDDPGRRRLSIDGVPVMGTMSEVERVAAATSAEVLIVAVARADAALLRRVSNDVRGAELQVLVVPSLEEMLGGANRLADLREVSIEDLVGRQPVDIAQGPSVDYVRGKTVLVTGAGGSIGSELCRQLSRLEPAELIMLDRDETALQQVQVSIAGHGLLDTREVVLADIRDGAALAEIFAARRPEVVFHAAALKHLPMLEQYPGEAWKTNVIGTLNVLDASEQVGVTTFVNISTDKAANPISVLGESKRLAERLTAATASRTNMRYLSVRFGNVLGSRGSLVPLFRSLLEAGEPLTVTHPEATRFFMSIPEACLLVTQAGAIGAPGEVLILDMGEPVKILDVARRMIDMAGIPAEIVYTGLRPGEKLHEELVGDGERGVCRVHPKISHAEITPLTPNELDPAEFMRDRVSSAV